MMRQPYLLVCVLIAVAALVAGCGGGGGGTTLAAPLATTLRSIQASDSFVYTIAGTLNDGTDTVTLSGTHTITENPTTVDVPSGGTASVMETSYHMVVNGSAQDGWRRDYVRQDATGTLWELGGEDVDGTWWITTPSSGQIQLIASPMSVGLSWGGPVTYSNGNSEDQHWLVTGTETVIVAAGQFECYKTTGVVVLDGIPGTATTWYSPQSGNFVKMVFDSSDTGTGVTMHATLSLQSKTRAAMLTLRPNGPSKVDLKAFFKK